MTVSYTGDVANGSSFGCFWKILGRWRGSVYKLIWRELIAYLFLYFTINAFYRLGMDEDQRRIFEKVKVYCSKQIESIPMSFVLGFYVTLIVKRWWDQYWILPMPDSLALYISTALQGQDEHGRLLRRTIMRYAMLAYIICLQRISFRVKKRFPTLQHLVDTGLMTESELKIFDLMDQKTKVLKFWMPVVWASNLINRARNEGRIVSDHMVQTIVTELSDFRRKLGRVMVFDTVSVPLVYTQVVTLAVYTYFLAALIGRQWVNPANPSLIYPGYELDLYFPIFLSLQFIFYIGWLKVAETLINPFGEDDDDFELNWLIDRHIKVSYMVVDEMHEEHPELLKDQYWEQVVPQDLPYNIASEHFRRHEPQGSTASLKIKPNESVYADLPNVKRHSVVPEEVYADYESVTDSPHPDSRKSWIQRQWSRVGSLRSTSSSSSRHRTHSHGHGPLPLSMPPHSGHSHRPSLYERILSRRSSKDQRNSNRYLSNKLNGTLNIGKDGNYNLMGGNPNFRPRVPTPDVTKENQVLTFPTQQPPLEKVNHTPNSHVNKEVGPMTRQENSMTGSPRETTEGSQSQPQPHAPQTPPANIVAHKPGTINPEPPPNPISKREMLPPPYDIMIEIEEKHQGSGLPGDISRTPSPLHPNGSILSPIAENDGSPYSTSSTTRSTRSSHYPTTTSIFGSRKPSPPPFEELPPLPGVRRGSQSSSSSSLKSDRSSSSNSKRRLGSCREIVGANDYDPDRDFGLRFKPSSVLNQAVNGMVNNGYIPDEDDSGQDYMTIAEVNESRAELEERLQEEHLNSISLLTLTPEASLSPPVLPLPRIPSPTYTISNGTPAVVSQNLCKAKDKQSLMTKMKEAIFPPNSVPDMSDAASNNNPPRVPSRNNNNNAIDHEHDPDDPDDGYDEKGSFNENEDEAIPIVSSSDDAEAEHPLEESCDSTASVIKSQSMKHNSSTSSFSSGSTDNDNDNGHSSRSIKDNESPVNLPPKKTPTPTPPFSRRMKMKTSLEEDDKSEASSSSSPPLPPNDNETSLLLLSPKKKKKSKSNLKNKEKSKMRGKTEKKEIDEVAETSEQKPTGLSKDCEVFV